MAAQSPSHRAFLKHLEAQAVATTDPQGLATQLYEDGLIDRLALQRASPDEGTQLERSRALLQTLDAKIQTDEGVFDKFLSILERDPTMLEMHKKLTDTRAEMVEERHDNSEKSTKSAISCHSPRCWLLVGALAVLSIAMLWGSNSADISQIYYQLNLCNSESLPQLGIFVGREEDIRNLTGYLDYTSSHVQVVHIVGPPGFGKSTLAIKIGHDLLRKCVKVHYVDMKDISDVDTLAEKILVNIIGSPEKKITMDRLKQWVHKQYTSTLLIFDNCDDMLETRREEFLEAIKMLRASSPAKSVKYLLTSQKWVADVAASCNLQSQL